jgi:hypothetical protein
MEIAKEEAGMTCLDELQVPTLGVEDNFKNTGSQAHWSWMYAPEREAGRL